MAEMGFRMITLASESQALRRGAAEHLREATACTSTPAGGYLSDTNGRAGHRCRAGQGAAIVKRLHDDGFRVAACDVRDRRIEGIQSNRSTTAQSPVHLDVTSEDQWSAAVAATVERFGA